MAEVRKVEAKKGTTESRRSDDRASDPTHYRRGFPQTDRQLVLSTHRTRKTHVHTAR